MKKSKFSIKDLISQLAFLAVGIAIFIYVLSTQDINKIKDTLLGAYLLPILAVILVSLLGHSVRAYRWQIIMDETGKTSFWNLLFSLQGKVSSVLF